MFCSYVVAHSAYTLQSSVYAAQWHKYVKVGQKAMTAAVASHLSFSQI